jgi:chromosome segregation ATPase
MAPLEELKKLRDATRDQADSLRQSIELAERLLPALEAAIRLAKDMGITSKHAKETETQFETLKKDLKKHRKGLKKADSLLQTLIEDIARHS